MTHHNLKRTLSLALFLLTLLAPAMGQPTSSTVLPDNVSEATCTLTPETSPWGIQLKWSSTAAASPLVNPLVGDIDGDGIPEIICFAPDNSYNFYGTRHVLVFDSRTHEVVHTFTLSDRITTVSATPYGIVKLPNGHVIFAVCMKNQGMAAYDLTDHATTPLWTSQAFDDNLLEPAVAFSDFNCDGWPELYIGNRIYDAATGTLLITGPEGANDGKAYTNSLYDGTERVVISFAYNVTGDIHPELLVGNQVYSVNITNRNGLAGNSMTLLATAPTPSGVPADGHAQVADFNLDGHPDILISTKDSPSHPVKFYVWDIYNNTVSIPVSIPSSTRGKSILLIADIDNDGSLEVVIQASISSYSGRIKAYKYNITGNNFTHMWDLTVDEDSWSNAMTMFDFNLDGMGDILVSDQSSIKILNGSGRSHLTGNDTVAVYALSSLSFGECTVMQYPVVADVDADGSAEIVVCGRFGSGHTWQGFLNVFHSATTPWAPARKVWNQYMYNVTSVNEDLTIPQYQFNNAHFFTLPDGTLHQPFNNFLQQATTIDSSGRPFIAVPDLLFSPEAPSTAIDGDSLRLTMSYTNQGDVLLATPYGITIYINEYRGQRLCTDTLYSPLPTATISTHTFSISLDSLCGLSADDSLLIVLNDLGTGIAQHGGGQAECDTTNNTIKMAVPSCETTCTSVIVSSGTTTNSYIPINGYTGNNLQRSQSIYPSEMLTDLVGKRIDSLHYFVNSGSFDGGDWTISIGVTRWQMLQFTFDNVSELTEVYHGPLIANNANGMGIRLDSTFAYAGGNLIIQFVQHIPSESSSCTFIGNYTSGSTSRHAITYSGNIMSQGGSSDYFLPKITFHACSDSTIDTSHVSTGVALPYCENFDNYATGEGHMPLYWQGHNTLSIDMGRYPLITNEYNTSPGNSLGMHIMGNNTCYAILPDFALDSLRHLNLSFMVRNKPTEQGILVIGVLPDTNDLNSFQPLDTIIPPGDHWMPVTYSFQNYQGTARRVVFIDRPRQGYSFSNIYIDDFIADTWIYPTIQQYGTHGVRVIAPENHSANYWLEYGEQGFVPGYDTSTVVHVTTSPFYITDLSSDTEYDFYFYPMLDSNTVVRSTCRNPLYITNCISRFDTTVTTCNSYSWHNHTYTSSGNYMDTLTITTGCDSIITLHLTINHNDSVALNISACDNYTWNVDGITYFSDTTLSASLPTNNGCDSLILLHLTILPSPQLQHIPDTVINLGQSLTLHAHGADMFTWSDADGVLLCNDSIITVNPATSTVYYLTAFNQGNNLVYNGDFELGNTGFTSAYTYNTNLNPEGRYYIGSNAHNYHYGFTGASDHTSGSGNFMIVNGSGTAGTNLWTQTVTVQPYTNYAFSVWGTNVSSYSQQYMAKLQFCINGTQIGDIFQLPTPMNTWTQFYEVWNSGPNTTATITILNMNTLLGGNDFGIDDISFSSLTTCQSNDTINVFVGHHIDSNVCASQYPFMWNGETFLHSGAKMATLSAINGTDSIVIMNAITRPEYHISTIDTICENTHYLFHGQLCDTSGQYTHIQPTVYGCDSLTILQLIILDTNSVDTIADVCNQLLWHGVTYTTNGSPEYQTTNVHGCDSTITLHLTVRRSTTSTDFQTACDTFTWIDGNKYSASGTTTHILTNTAGCDSIITLNLTIRHSSIDTDTHTACDTYTWIDGNTYTTSNNSATYTLNNTDGCDSIVTLALTINHANTGTETVTACNSFVWHGTEYSESTTMPTHDSTNSAGCDSVTTLHLTINHCSTTTITACDNYSWHGNVYTSSGVYTIGTDTLILTINNSSISTETVTACNSYSWHGNTYSANNNTATHTETNALGCDSTVTLNLTINYSNTGDTSATACDEFSWYGTNYNTSTTPTLTLTNVAGCDSTVTLHLTINHSNNATIDTVACNSFVWHGTEYTASTTTPTHTDINAAGCDSVTTLHLTINHCSTTTITVCDSYLWNGNIYTESGTYIFGEDTLNLTINHSSASDTSATVCDSIIWYGTVYTVTSSPTHTLTNTMGCDSVETLYLTVNHSNSITETITACDTLIWHGVAYTTSNNTDFHIETNAAGCDSIITLNLTVNYSNTGIETVTTCDSYSWHGITYTDNNSTAKHTGINVAGCDSITTLHLTLNHSNAGVETVTACDTFIWHGNTYTSNNSTATYTETNSAGCDSIITLNLTINYSTTGDTTITDCDSISWNGTIYTSSQDIYPITYLNSWGCDSLVTLHLTVNVSTSQEVNEAACYSFEWPTASGQLLTSSGEYRDTSTNAVGCDSVTTLNLIISRCLVNSDTACDNYIWHGNTYTSSGVYTDNLDTLELTILNSSMVIDTQTACDTFTWIDGRNYTSSNDTTTIVLTNVVGCDSIIALHLTLHHSVSSIDTIAACDSVIWIDGVTYNTSDSLASHNLTTTTGCDSTVTLHLTLHHSTQTTLYDTICHDQNYTWNGYTFHSDNHEQTESIHFSATLNTIYGCDSTANMIITKMAQPQIHFDSNKDCHTLSYTLTAIATAPLSPDAEPQPMPYLLWSSSPDDPLLHGQENNPTILVSPHSVTEYTLYADYKPTPMCPVSANIILRPLVPTKAELKIVPEALDYGHPDFTAYDISHHQEVERTWYLDWQQQSETGNILSSRADIDADSIIVALTLDNNICRDTAVAVIPIHRVAIFAPNVFTPLEDNNNRFVISCTGIIDADMYIYNREGLLIYHTTDFEQGWDGHNTNGTLCPQGAYVWRIYYHAENHPKKLQTKVGTILLLK